MPSVMYFMFWFDCTKGYVLSGRVEDTWSLFCFNLEKTSIRQCNTEVYDEFIAVWLLRGMTSRELTLEKLYFYPGHQGMMINNKQIIFSSMPMANKLVSCFKRPISVSAFILLILEASLSYQGSSLIDLFFLSPTLYSSDLLRFVLIYLNCPRIKY